MMDEASRLHFGKFNVSKFTQIHYAGPHEVSSIHPLKKQLCHKMWPKKTNFFSSSNLTAIMQLILFWLLGREFRCVNITGHFLMNMAENAFSSLYPHFWRKLSIGRLVVFEMRRLIEHMTFMRSKL